MSGNTLGFIWALVAAIVLAFQGVASMPALRQMGILSVSLLTNFINMIVLGMLGFWTYKTGQFDWIGLGWFTLLGITAYSYGRFVYYKALQTLGPPRLTTIMSTAPLLSLLLAVLFLAERPGVSVLAGTLLVSAGVVLVSYAPSESGWFHRGILWGFASALSLGVSTFIRKKGIAAFPNMALTIAWGNMIGMLFLYGISRYTPPKLFEWGSRKVIIVISLLAILNSANQVFMNLALFYGDVSVVTPIITSSPVFSLVFTALFLRAYERVRWAMVLGVLATVAGMLAIVMAR